VAWIAALGVLLFLAGLYPLLATRAKIADRMAGGVPPTLDGMAYMLYAVRYEDGTTFNLAPDYQAIRWLQDNVTGTPVVLEAHTVEYRWGSRISIYTGLPAVVGWNWHQRQQRPWQSEEVFARVTDVETLYNTTDIAYSTDLLRRYNVQYIIVGDLERVRYNAAGLGKFNAMVAQGLLEVVYDRDGTVIYHVATGHAGG
jgi:uncharacterized membrane protein